MHCHQGQKHIHALLLWLPMISPTPGTSMSMATTVSRRRSGDVEGFDFLGIVNHKYGAFENLFGQTALMLGL